MFSIVPHKHSLEAAAESGNDGSFDPSLPHLWKGALVVPKTTTPKPTFTEFPSDCLLLILCCLMVDGLVNVAQVSRRFRDECRHESLPQSRTATVPCCTTASSTQTGDSGGTNSLQSLLHKLLAMQATGKVARFNKLKLIAHPSLDKLPMKAVRQITSGIQL